MSAAPSSSRRRRSASFGVKLKHSANRAMIEGKRIVLVDDSIVRGTTSLKIVQDDARCRRNRGAHPHLLAADHPSRLLRHRHADREKLLANQYTDIQAMAKFIGADSLEFLTIDGLYRAVGGEARNNARPQFTDHYFTGDYPTRLLDKNGDTTSPKLSMLASNG
jgi:amidophosphoribosyltransferase